MQHEAAVDADVVRDTADGEGAAHRVAVQPDHDAFKDLDALAAALDDLDMHAHRISRLQLRAVVAQLRLFDRPHQRGHRHATILLVKCQRVVYHDTVRANKPYVWASARAGACVSQRVDRASRARLYLLLCVLTRRRDVAPPSASAPRARARPQCERQTPHWNRTYASP